MTKLGAGTARVRETAGPDRAFPIIVALHPSHLVLRSGLHENDFVAYDALLWRVMKNSAERLVSERLARRTRCH